MPVCKPERGHDLNLRLLECAPHGCEVDVNSRSSLEHDQPADAQAKPVESKLGSAVAERANDTAPVGVASVYSSLDQARRGDRSGGSPGLLIRLCALDANRDHFGRALTIARDRARQLASDVDDRSLQRLRFRRAVANEGIARRAVGKEE